MYDSKNQCELESLLKEFTEQNGVAFTSGYYQSMLISMFHHLKKRDQKWEIQRMRREVERGRAVKNLVDRVA